MVAGGIANNGVTTNSAELYDPATCTNQFTGFMSVPRRDHTATLLPNGRLLVAGGFNGSQVISRSELYDPATRTWTATGAMNVPRRFHTSTLLPNAVLLGPGLTAFEVAVLPSRRRASSNENRMLLSFERWYALKNW